MEKAALVAVAVAAAFTLGFARPATAAQDDGGDARAAKVVRAALAQRGIPYRRGGATPGAGFDCSGLVSWAYGRVGIELPHSSQALAGTGRRVARDGLRPGDVLVFDDAGHVGLYVGGGRFVHAPRGGEVVEVVRLDGWYGAKYEGARRIV